MRKQRNYKVTKRLGYATWDKTKHRTAVLSNAKSSFSWESFNRTKSESLLNWTLPIQIESRWYSALIKLSTVNVQIKLIILIVSPFLPLKNSTKDIEADESFLIHWTKQTFCLFFLTVWFSCSIVGLPPVFVYDDTYLVCPASIRLKVNSSPPSVFFWLCLWLSGCPSVCMPVYLSVCLYDSLCLPLSLFSLSPPPLSLSLFLSLPLFLSSSLIFAHVSVCYEKRVGGIN